MEKEKLYQKLFKPIFATALFGLALVSFRGQIVPFESLAEFPQQIIE
jgi:hypothetical protein